MYTIKVSYGDYDDIEGPEPDVVETLGTYESLDEACDAAEDKFYAIVARLSEAFDARCDEIKTCRDNHCIRYGYYDCEISRWDNRSYYMVSVVEQ